MIAGLYEPRKSSRSRHFGRRDISGVAHLGEVPHHARIEKREVQEKQVVSITLGVRGLMVGSDADLRLHRLVKRVADVPHVITQSEADEFQVPVLSFQTLILIAVVSILMIFTTTVVYLLGQRHRRMKHSVADRVITVAPKLLNK